MRLALTIGRVDDKWTVLSGPSHDVIPHKVLFKQIVAGGGQHGKTDLQEVRTFTTDGALERRHVFATDAQCKAHTARQAADLKTFEAAQKARETAKAPKSAAPVPVKKETKS